MEQAGGANLLRAVRQVLAGHHYVSAAVSEKLLVDAARAKPSASPIAKLSQREFEVFQFVGQGKSNLEIARSLHLSQKTVAAHRNHIRQKLGLHTPAELVRFAISFQEGFSPARVRNK